MIEPADRKIEMLGPARASANGSRRSALFDRARSVSSVEDREGGMRYDEVRRDPHLAEDVVPETMVRVQLNWRRVVAVDVPDIYADATDRHALRRRVEP